MKRYELNSSLAFKYFKEVNNDTNELSSTLFRLVDLEKEGKFFTFLPDDVNMEKIHEFTHGGLTKSLKAATAFFLLEKLSSKKDYHLIFDEVTRYYEELLGYDLFDNYGMHYRKEPYYLLNSKSYPSMELMRECLRASDAMWHSLGVLFSGNLNNLENRTLTLPIISEICRNADLILTIAYDSEGYIFWERVKNQGQIN